MNSVFIRVTFYNFLISYETKFNCILYSNIGRVTVVFPGIIAL